MDSPSTVKSLPFCGSSVITNVGFAESTSLPFSWIRTPSTESSSTLAATAVAMGKLSAAKNLKLKRASADSCTPSKTE